MISLFVPPGDYKAILECLIPETGADAQRIVSSGTPLEPDGKYSFSLKYVHKDFGYSFDCAISDKGVVFIELSGHDEIEVTG